MSDPDGRFTIPVHKKITEEALKLSGLYNTFLYGGLSNAVIEGATWIADILHADQDFHFDGQQNYTAVNKRWGSLNREITENISKIGIGNKLFGGEDSARLGMLIHNVQDFYSHSNYVELYIEYYNGINGIDPTSVPIYDEGIKDVNFNKLLKERLRTGDASALELIQEKIYPQGSLAQSPTSHMKMNKDKVDSNTGELARDAATKHTEKILNRIKE
jgi:hypothetical protein